MGRNYGGDYEFGSFFKAFTEPMNRGLKTCLVDPKRKIESQAQINTSVKLSTDGSNLLNRLFFLKNDEPHSQGYEIYKNIYQGLEKLFRFSMYIDAKSTSMQELEILTKTDFFSLRRDL